MGALLGAGGVRSRVRLLYAREVVDDETVHPGMVVWLLDSELSPDELARLGRRRRRHRRQDHCRGESGETGES